MKGYVSKDGNTLVLPVGDAQYCIDIGNIILKARADAIDTAPYVGIEIPDKVGQEIADRVERLSANSFQLVRTTLACDIYERSKQIVNRPND